MFDIRKIDGEWWSLSLPNEKESEWLLKRLNPERRNKFFGLYIIQSTDGKVGYYSLDGLSTDEDTAKLLLENRTRFPWVAKFTPLVENEWTEDDRHDDLRDGFETYIGSLMVGGKVREPRPLEKPPLEYRHTGIEIVDQKSIATRIPVIKYGKSFFSEGALLSSLTLRDLQENNLYALVTVHTLNLSK